MNAFRNLADTTMQAAGLDQQRLRRLVWCWQSLAHPADDRIAGDSVARLLDGQPVPERDATIAHAALITVLPSILDQAALQRALFKHDKVLNILAASGSTCTLSPWRFVRVWSGEDLAGFARELGLERRTLRRLEEAPWLGGPVSDPVLEVLGDLGCWFGANAVSLADLGALSRPCDVAA